MRESYYDREKKPINSILVAEEVKGLDVYKPNKKKAGDSSVLFSDKMYEEEVEDSNNKMSPLQKYIVAITIILGSAVVIAAALKIFTDIF